MCDPFVHKLSIYSIDLPGAWPWRISHPPQEGDDTNDTKNTRISLPVDSSGAHLPVRGFHRPEEGKSHGERKEE